MPNSLKCRLKGLVRKGLLSEKDLSRIYTDNDMVEELEEIKKEIQNLSTNNFLEMIPKGEAIQIIDNHIEEKQNETDN